MTIQVTKKATPITLEIKDTKLELTEMEARDLLHKLQLVLGVRPDEALYYPPGVRGGRYLSPQRD